MKANDIEQFALSGSETRNVITPYAFKIDQALLGIPLATPIQRAMAMIIDVILIFMAAKLSATLIAFVAAMAFYKGTAQQYLPKMSSFWRKTLKLFAATFLFVSSLTVLSLAIEFFEDDNAIQEIQIEQAENAKTKSEETKPVTSILQWGKGIIQDLGLGFGWAAVYFTLFSLLWRGQTPGKKVFNIRVVALSGESLGMLDCFGRYGGYGAGFATGLLGFLQVYWDPNRQAIQDKISATVVIQGSVKQVINVETIEETVKSE